MKRYLVVGAFISALLPLTAAAPAHASTLYYTEFQAQQPELAYEIYENGGHGAGQACGTDACTTFEQQGNRTYGRFAITPSSTPGFYQNAATSQIALGGPTVPTDAGPYSLSNGQSITLEAKIKWSNNYDLYGQSTAQGTSGIVFWNSSIGEFGQTPEYDQLGFTWSSQDVLPGFFGNGFNAGSFMDVFPVGVSYPTGPVNIHDWVKVKMVWSQDGNGTQTATYYADGELIATHELPAQLHGLSLEIWNDNQEPFFCETGFCTSFPNPVEEQSFYVDYVKITQS